MPDFESRLLHCQQVASVDNWDLVDGDRAVPAELWQQAREVYQATIDLGMEPFLSPGDASAHLSWAVNSGKFNLEIGWGQCWISYKNPGEDQYWHLGGDLEKSITEVRKWLSSVSISG
jgi:hypothetical protein